MAQKQESVRPNTLLVVVVLIGILVATLFGAFKLGGVFEKKQSDIASCSATQTAHTVIIENNTVTPQHTNASQCDTLTIINKDDKLRIVAFGQHEHHTAYDGVEERLVKKDEQVAVTLNQLGSFTFHDHNQDEVQGTFTVNP